jgi:hypothetical protein
MKKPLLIILTFLALFSFVSGAFYNVSYSSGDDAQLNFGNTAGSFVSLGQIFKTLSVTNLILREASIKLYRNANTTGPIKLYLSNTNGSNPIGTPLCFNNTIQPSTLSTSTGSFKLFKFYNCPSLASATSYIIWANGTLTGQVSWRVDSSSPTYANGSTVEQGSLTSKWIIRTNDNMFSLKFETATPAFNNIKINGTTLTTDSYWKTNKLLVVTNVTQTSNQTYYFRHFTNGTLISSSQFATNQKIGYVNISTTNGKYKLSFLAKNVNGTTNTVNYTITIDTTAPTIINNMPIYPNYLNSYSINHSSYITCTDTNLQLCNITYSTSSQKFNASQKTLKTLTRNGNLSYSIFAKDFAGNNATTTGVLFVNPNATFYFKNGSRYLTNYSFGGKTTTGNKTIIRFYGDGMALGNNTLSFSKLGYTTQSFIVAVNTTKSITTTYNVSQSKIRLTFKNKKTSAILSGRTIIIQLIGSVGLNTSTTTGYKNISNTFITSGFYQILASSTGYTSESVFFDYTNQENLDRTIYMINSSYINLGYITIAGTDSIGIPISGCYARALQWDAGSSSFLTTSEVITSTDGKGNVYVLLEEKSYKFSLTCNNVTVYAPQEVIETVENGKIIPLTMTTTDTQIGYSPYSVTGDVFLLSTLNSTMRTSTIQFNFNNIVGTDVTGCAVVYKTIGSVQVEQTRVCNTTVNGVVFIPNYYFNTTYTYKVAGEVNQGNGYFEVDQLIVSSATSFANIFSMFLIIIPVLIMGLAFALGLSMDQPANLITSQILGIAGAINLYFIVPSIIDLTSSFVIMAIICLTLWGVVRK